MKINELLNKFNNSFVIGPSEFRSLFILEKNKNLDLTFDYETKKTILNALFGKYSLASIKEVIKKDSIGYDEAKAYLEYYCSGFPIDEKHKYLVDDKLIYVDSYFKNILQNKHVVFFGYTKGDQEIKHIIEFLNLKDYEFVLLEDFELETNPMNYLVFNNAISEVKYVLNDISIRIKDNNKTPQDFVILANDDYIFYIDLLSKYFKLPVNTNKSKSLFDTYSAKVVLNNLNLDFLEFVSKNEELFSNDKDNIELIKYLYSFFDLKNSKNYVADFVAILKDYKLNCDKYINAIEVDSQISFDSNKQYYILGALDNFLPKSYGDNDYLSDNEKSKNYLATSDVKNDFSYKVTELFIKYKNVIHISYPSYNGKNKVAFILSLYKFQSQKPIIQMDQFSKEVANLFYNDYLIKFKNFNDINSELGHYLPIFSSNNGYDNSFNGIARSVSGGMSFSASAMEDYAECPFRYYCKTILRLNENSDNTGLKFGKFTHKILEHVYDADFSVQKCAQQFAKDFDFDNREMVLLKRYLEDLEDTAKNITELNAISPFKETKSEYEIVVNNAELNLNGRIDRINLYKDALIIIDYKSGAFDFNPDNFNEMGIGLQLPTYLYLISNDKAFDNYKIGGVFIQPTNHNSFYNYLNPNKKDSDFKKLNGIVNKNSKYVFEFDKSLESNSRSSYLLSVKVTSDLLIHKGNPVGYSNEDFVKLVDTLKKWFKEFSKEISNNNFKISPYATKDFKKTSCDYCSFSDICFKKKSDYRIIGKDGEEETDDANDN